jgi:hypothetical protein
MLRLVGKSYDLLLRPFPQKTSVFPGLEERLRESAKRDGGLYGSRTLFGCRLVRSSAFVVDAIGELRDAASRRARFV